MRILWLIGVIAFLAPMVAGADTRVNVVGLFSGKAVLDQWRGAENTGGRPDLA